MAQTFLNVVYSKPRSKQCTKLYRFSFSFFFHSFFFFIYSCHYRHSALLCIQIVVCQPCELRQVHFHAIYTIQTHTRILNAVSRILPEFVCEPLIVVNINFRLKMSRMFAMFDFNSGHYTATYTHTYRILCLPPSRFLAHQPCSMQINLSIAIIRIKFNLSQIVGLAFNKHSKDWKKNIRVILRICISFYSCKSN